MITIGGRNGAGWRRSVLLVATLVAHASPVPLPGADGIPATVVTLNGESIEGRFLGANAWELTLETPAKLVTLSLRDVSYVSFAGRPPSAEAVSFVKPAGPISQLRMEGSASERAGQLDEALRKYEEAAKLDPSDALAVKAVERVRQKMAAQDAAKKSAIYKKAVLELKEARRYGEAAACYDQAIRLDPYDQKFKEGQAALRHYWEPTTCPVPDRP